MSAPALDGLETPEKTQWIWPAPQGRPGCAYSPLPYGLESPGETSRWMTRPLCTAVQVSGDFQGLQK